MQICVEVLGCGDAFSPNLGNSSFLIWTKESEACLFDCGSDVFTKLSQKKILDKINHVVISHLHDDHAGSLGTLAYYKSIIDKQKINLTIANEFLQYFDARCSDICGRTHINSQDKNFNIKMFPVKHTDSGNSYGAVINDIYFSGDTCEVISEQLAKRCELIFHDVDFSNSSTVHCHYSKLQCLPSEIKSKIVLYHYSQNITQENLRKQIINDGFRELATPGRKFFIGETFTTGIKQKVKVSNKLQDIVSIINSKYDLKIILNSEECPPNTSCYTPGTNLIECSALNNEEALLCIIFHELGHFLAESINKLIPAPIDVEKEDGCFVLFAQELQAWLIGIKEASKFDIYFSPEALEHCIYGLDWYKDLEKTLYANNVRKQQNLWKLKPNDYDEQKERI